MTDDDQRKSSLPVREGFCPSCGEKLPQEKLHLPGGLPSIVTAQKMGIRSIPGSHTDLYLELFKSQKEKRKLDADTAVLKRKRQMSDARLKRVQAQVRALEGTTAEAEDSGGQQAERQKPTPLEIFRGEAAQAPQWTKVTLDY